MAKINARSLELIHEWSTAQKAAYNREYYRKNKDRWKDGYSKVGVSPRDRWQLDLARRRGELDDNHDRMIRAMRRDDDYRTEEKAAMQRHNNISNLITGRQYSGGTMKSELQKAQEQAWKEAITARKKSNAATGDFYRSIAMRDLHDAGKVKNAPQATMKPQSKVQLVVNRIKRSATKAAKVASSKAHSVGKAFIDNWKAGWG